MSTVRSSHDNQRIVLHSKGAPEIVLGHCTSFRDADGSIKPLTMGKRKEILNTVKAMAREGLRTIALTSREIQQHEAHEVEHQEGSWERYVLAAGSFRCVWQLGDGVSACVGFSTTGTTCQRRIW